MINLNIIIIKDGKLYTGKYNGRIYEWQESADEVSTNKELEEVLGFSLDGLNVSNVNSTKFDSYESIVDFVTSQDADANTYANIISFFDFLGVVLSNDKVKINNTGTKTTIDFNFDLSQVLQKLIPDISESTLSAIKLVFSSSLTLNKNKVSTEKMNLEFVGDSEDSKEMIGFKASLDNKYKDINKVFLIEAPAF